MDIELLHESVNAVPAVLRVVQAIDPISHAPIAQDVVESFIILLDQLGDDLVFFFRFWDIALQPLIIGCSRNTDLPAQPVNAPAFFCVALLDCFIGYRMAQLAEFHLPSRAFNFFNLNFAPLKRRKTSIKSREIQPFSFALCTILSDFPPDCR